MIKTLFWKKNKLHILNQRLLPRKIRYTVCSNHKQVFKAIKDMIIRGAPAIGVAAAYGVALACLEKDFKTNGKIKAYLENAKRLLASSRPTAVNLFWTLERMQKIIDNSNSSLNALRKDLLKEAEKIFIEDISVNQRIGDFGAQLLNSDSVVLTHCNAGALATAGYGTALGVIRSAYKKGKIKLVYIDETRPYLQGARLTAWELKQEKIPYKIITDNMAGHLMRVEKIDAVVVGADRIAANGDTANKIGTYSLAILADYHKIPFFVAAPVSTIDLNTNSGDDIKIEERSADEVIYINNKLIAPKGSLVRHPAFDVTPAKYIKHIITERGIINPSQIRDIITK